MTGADNQLITVRVRVRVRQVSADLGYINIDICPYIGKVSVYGRWSSIREVVEGRFYCIPQSWCFEKLFFVLLGYLATHSMALFIKIPT